MKSVGWVDSRPRPRAEREVEETMRTLFRRLSGLAGFSVTDAADMLGAREAGRLEGDLCLSDITLAPGYACECFGEIAVVLIDLLEEHPEARELLRGRTFARAVN